MNRDNRLWLRFHKDTREILAYASIFYMAILIFSGFNVIPTINIILNIGVIAYLDYIKY